MHPDRPRVEKLINDFFDNLDHEVAIDEAMIIAISTRRDEDDDLCEDPIQHSTTGRLFAQLGMLEASLENHKQRMFYSNGSDGNDEDE